MLVTQAWNSSSVTMFILLGFTDHPELQDFLYVTFLSIYLVTLAWNLALIFLIRGDAHLHTPMYFFLSNLSFIDICYSSTVAPKMLTDFFQEQKTISFLGCAAQFFFFVGMGLTECFLLTAMAYDRYAAISSPLLYTTLMSQGLCARMVVGAYMGGFLSSLIQACSIFRLHFCGPNVINHFFCDLPPILALSCSNTFVTQVVNFLVVVAVGGTSFLILLVSYSYIVSAVVKIRSVEGRCKAFNTCASHLTVVTLLFGTALFMYLRPSSSYSLGRDKVVSVFYSLVIPMLNPLIYSLRNREIKDALWKVMGRKKVFS
ncbi:olfactory receptor 5A1 [Ictidomys tridecemlineatus]|uniref:olfactory receptor 5A1 n=1 Tax=Ictidomys tridecemlineatus TaxID=43179 RepID=UPI00025DE0E9|nr:olfactory receptor 5A1 [Ictidomys tridecemlineatus]KAG3284973.1 olfactory receptor 5A1 [Ictidomys tridecemlineatus]